MKDRASDFWNNLPNHCVRKLPLPSMEQRLETTMKKNVTRIQDATIRGNLTIQEHNVEDQLQALRAELGLL